MTKEEFSKKISEHGWQLKTKNHVFEKWFYDTYNRELWLYPEGFTILDLGVGCTKRQYPNDNFEFLVQGYHALENIGDFH